MGVAVGIFGEVKMKKALVLLVVGFLALSGCQISGTNSGTIKNGNDTIAGADITAPVFASTITATKKHRGQVSTHDNLQKVSAREKT